MVELYSANYISLHVRETNFAAFHLYRDTLQFSEHGIEPKYYADGENAFDMRKKLTREMFGLAPIPKGAAGSKEGREGRALEAPVARLPDYLTCRFKAWI
jgi:hypothetical protein